MSTTALRLLARNGLTRSDTYTSRCRLKSVLSSRIIGNKQDCSSLSLSSSTRSLSSGWQSTKIVLNGQGRSSRSRTHHVHVAPFPFARNFSSAGQGPPDDTDVDTDTDTDSNIGTDDEVFVDEQPILTEPTDDKTETYSTDNNERFCERTSHLQRMRLNRMEPLFDKVDKLVNVPMGQLHPLDIAFTFVELMIDCCKLKNMEGMKYARDLLDRLLGEKRFVNEEVLHEGESGSELPMIISAHPFEKLMYGWAVQTPRVQVAYDRMKEVVDLMAQEDAYDQEFMKKMPEDVRLASSVDTTRSRRPCQPTTNTFNILVRGLAAAAKRHDEAAFEAESYLKIMTDHHVSTKGWFTKPNNRTYTHVITAFANTATQSSGKRAQNVLDLVKEVYETERETYKTEYGVPFNVLHPEANVKRIVYPDAFMYASVISAHANSGAPESTDKALALMLEVVDGKIDGVVADNMIFTNGINALTKITGKRNKPSVRFQAAKKAESLLWKMTDLAKKRAEEQAQLERESVVAKAANQNWEEDNDNDLYDHDELDDENRRVKKIDQFSPNVVTYNTVLNAWAKSDVQESAPAAEALLQRMLEECMADETAVEPDVISFNTVIHAWARFHVYESQAPQKAEELLNFMYEIYNSGRLNGSVQPDAQTYTAVINAWARGGNGTDNTSNARRLLESMLSKYEADDDKMKPNVVSFTAVLNAAVNCPPGSGSMQQKVVTDKEAFSSTATNHSDPYAIALQTYDELWNDTYDLNIRPDHFTFATMIQVVGVHTDKASAERRQLVVRIFEDACSAGHVSSLVIRALREACPSTDLLESLLGGKKRARSLRSVDELPRDWSRHIGREKRFRFLDDRQRVRMQPKKRSTQQRN